MPMLKSALRHLKARFVQRVFQSKISSVTIIFIEKVFILKSNPNPKNSNRQPIPKNYLKKCHLIGYRVNGRGYKIKTFNIKF